MLSGGSCGLHRGRRGRRRYQGYVVHIPEVENIMLLIIDNDKSGMTDLDHQIIVGGSCGRTDIKPEIVNIDLLPSYSSAQNGQDLGVPCGA